MEDTSLFWCVWCVAMFIIGICIVFVCVLLWSWNSNRYDLKLATKVWDRLEVTWDNWHDTKIQTYAIYEVEKMCSAIK